MRRQVEVGRAAHAGERAQGHDETVRDGLDDGLDDGGRAGALHILGERCHAVVCLDRLD